MKRPLLKLLLPCLILVSSVYMFPSTPESLAQKAYNNCADVYTEYSKKNSELHRYNVYQGGSLENNCEPVRKACIDDLKSKKCQFYLNYGRYISP